MNFIILSTEYCKHYIFHLAGQTLFYPTFTTILCFYCNLDTSMLNHKNFSLIFRCTKCFSMQISPFHIIFQSIQSKFFHATFYVSKVWTMNILQLQMICKHFVERRKYRENERNIIIFELSKRDWIYCNFFKFLFFFILLFYCHNFLAFHRHWLFSRWSQTDFYHWTFDPDRSVVFVKI